MCLKTIRRGLLRAASLMLLAVSAYAMAQDAALAKRVDLFLKDADLLPATQALTRQTGIQFIVAPSNEPFDRINLSLNGVTAEEAIRYLCQAAGAWAERDENGVYIIRRGKPEPKVEPTTDVKAPTLIRKIKLMHADPKEVYDMITNDLVFDPVDGLKRINRLTEEALQISRPSHQGANLTVIGQGPLGPTSYPMPSNLVPNTLPSAESGSGIVLPGEGANQGLGGGGGGAGLGGGGGFGQPGGGGQNNQQGGQGSRRITDGQGNNFIPAGIKFVSYDPNDNSLIVVAENIEAINKLQQAIALFDNAPQQVQIKVEFVSVSDDLAKSFGIDWLYSRGGVQAGARPGDFANPNDPIFINYSTGNIAARLRTQLQGNKGRVVTAPLIRTLNNQFALVQTTTTVTYQINQIVNGPGGIITVPQLQSTNATTLLALRPRINGDRTITMNLTPQVQAFLPSSAGTTVPDVTSTSINVVARVKDGETIVLAGLTAKNDGLVEKKFPVLADIPVIGQFFTSKNTTRKSTELLVFVTPTIIEDDTTGNGP